MSEEQKTPLLEVKNIKKWFPSKKSPFSKEKVYIKAVDGVSFTLNAGETLGVVGESGCGKSTMGRTVLRLLEPTEGQVFFEGKEYTALKDAELRKSRSELQIIFQDPYASLDPRMTIGDIIAEPLDIQLKLPAKERMERVLKTMERVGLNTRYVNRYPHEFSGGQRQRVGIARALAVDPEFIVCDEPVSALDVSIQAQIIHLLKDLRKELDLTYLFIGHDLSVVRSFSDRVAVMYLGKLMEVTASGDLYTNPLHPYTKALLSAVPIPDPVADRQRERILLKGEVPSPMHPPSGCRFCTRCDHATDRCRTEEPVLKPIGGDHWVACHLVQGKEETVHG